MAADTDRARDALQAIPPDLPRDEWVRAGMAAQAAGLDFDTFNDWSAGAGNYSERDARDTWRSFKPGKGVGAGTLYRVAAEHGWRMGEGKPQQRAMQAPRKAAEPQRKPAPGMSPAEVWAAAKLQPLHMATSWQRPQPGCRWMPCAWCLLVTPCALPGSAWPGLWWCQRLLLMAHCKACN